MINRYPKYLAIFTLFTLFFSSVAFSTFTVPSEWKKWVQDSKDSFKEKFSAPTITHHIYLEKVGDQAFLDLQGAYPRWAKKGCEKCHWKIVLQQNKKLQLVNVEKNLTLELPMKKQTSLPDHDGLFIAPMTYEGDSKVRVFIHDLNQSKLTKKRERKFFEYNGGYLVMGKFRWLSKPKKAVIQRSDGSQKNLSIFAEVDYEMTGAKTPNTLSVYNFSDGEGYKDQKATMLLYRDYSNGKETYGAGRFMNVYFDKKIGELKDGDRVVLDFNYSYNPPCAVSTGFHCPLPQDTVKLKVLAGEKYSKP